MKLIKKPTVAYKMPWYDKTWGMWLIIITGIVGVMSFVIGIPFYIEYYTNDTVVFEDSQIICYNDYQGDKPNSSMRFYCLDKESGEMTCQTDGYRGAFREPVAGCYKE